MNTTKLIIWSLFLLLISSCTFNEIEDPCSGRSYETTYSLLKEYIFVNENNQYELVINEEIIESLRVRPTYIGLIKADLNKINQDIEKAMNDPLCSQVIMSTIKQGIMVKKSDPSLKLNISDEVEEENFILTRAGNPWMTLYTNEGNGIKFTSTDQVHSVAYVSPGWGTYSVTIYCSTGKLSSGKNYTQWTGSMAITLNNWWYANNKNGDNTNWQFTSNPLGSGAQGSIVFKSV